MNKLAQKDTGKLIIKLAIPMVVTLLITNFYNLVDTFFVSKISISAMSAVGVLFPVMSVIQAISMVFAFGSSSFISRLLGKSDEESASVFFSTSLILASIASVVVAISCYFLSDEILKLSSASETNFEFSATYLKIIILGTPFSFLTFVLSQAMRAEGNATKTMVGMSVGLATNLILDPLFIFTFKWGIGGAATATVLSQFLSLVALIFIQKKGKTSLIFSFKSFSKRKIFPIFKMGISSFLRQSLVAVSAVFLNRFAQPFGDYVLASSTQVSKLTMVGFAIILGICQGYAPALGFCHGKRDTARQRQCFLFTLKLVLVVSVIEIALILPFGNHLIALLQSDEQVTALGSKILKFSYLAMPIMGSITLLNITFQAIGKSFKNILISLFHQGVIYIVVLYFSVKFFHLDGFVYSRLLSEVISFVILLPLFFSLKKELRVKNVKTQKESKAQKVEENEKIETT